jgi:hypothetical protein
MKSRAYLLLSLLSFGVAQADDKPSIVNPATAAPAHAAPTAKPNFDLHDAAIRQIVRDTVESLPSSSTAANPDSRFAARLGSLSIHDRKVPFAVHCSDSVSNDCAAYDADGNELYRIPRNQVYPVDFTDLTTAASCISSNDLLTTFDRADRCRGIGVLLPTPWDRVNIAVPLFRRD